MPPLSTTCSNRHTPQVLTTPLALRRVTQFVDRLGCGKKKLELDTDRKCLACGTKTLCPHPATASSYVYFLNSIAYMPFTQNWIIVLLTEYLTTLSVTQALGSNDLLIMNKDLEKYGRRKSWLSLRYVCLNNIGGTEDNNNLVSAEIRTVPIPYSRKKHSLFIRLA